MHAFMYACMYACVCAGIYALTYVYINGMSFLYIGLLYFLPFCIMPQNITCTEVCERCESSFVPPPDAAARWFEFLKSSGCHRTRCSVDSFMDRYFVAATTRNKFSNPEAGGTTLCRNLVTELLTCTEQ